MKKKSSKKRFLWITDPWDTLDHPQDTTLRLIEESLLEGVESFWCDFQTIRLTGSNVTVDACRVETVGKSREAREIRMLPPLAMHPVEFNSIHYRTDPPVDLGYIHPLQILALVTQRNRRVQLVNPAEVLLVSNEKLEAALLGDLMPMSLVSSHWESLFAFGRSEGKTVAKPLHQAQSKGVELLDWVMSESLARNKAFLSEQTAGFTRPVMLQRYLAGIKDGEQRLWYLDGKLLAAARKRPRAGEFRIDMDQGGTLVTTRLTAREKSASVAIGKRLRARRIRLAAVDLIDGYVTDFNFTSPGLLVQMERVLGKNLARPVIQALLRTR